MFTEGLLQLVKCKMVVDIDKILEDDEIFSHFVDEVYCLKFLVYLREINSTIFNNDFFY